jgi:hypothetical protein
MMCASHYMSEWTSVLSLCEMPIRRGVGARDRAKSRAGTGLLAAHNGGLCVRGNYGWRSEDRRYEGQVKRQVNGAQLKLAATNSTATSNSEPTSTAARFNEAEPAATRSTATSNSKPTSTLERFRASNFGVLFCERHFTEVKNEKLQH